MAENTAGTFTQVPASAQFSALYAQVANYVMGPSDTEVTAIAKECINDAIARLNSRAWTWSRSVTDITFIAGEAGREYALAGKFKSARAFELLNASSVVIDRLLYEDGKTFDRWFQDRSYGDPTHYTVFNQYDNGYLTLNGPPSAGFVARTPTGRLRYYKRIPTLSGDSDTLSGPHEVERFVVWYARSSVAAIWQPDKAAFADRRSSDLWRALTADDLRMDLRDFTG